MNMDPPGPHSLRKSPQSSSEEASNSGDSSPMPAVLHPEVNYSCLQMSATEMLHTKTASPCPSSIDLPLQDSPDSSTNPKLKRSSPEADEGPEKKGENKVLARKQKMWIVFSQAQLNALKNRFQRQRYLSFQQMQEPSTILNLSCKQIKTWFQNQRTKCKRWQKNQWLKTSDGLTQKGSAPMEYPSIHCSYPQGYLVNTSGSLPMWGGQTWTNPTWNNQTWINPTRATRPGSLSPGVLQPGTARLGTLLCSLMCHSSKTSLPVVWRRIWKPLGKAMHILAPHKPGNYS